MDANHLDGLKADLQRLIVEACDKPQFAQTLSDDEPLFGAHSRIALDSLDALQLAMAIKKAYGLRITDSKETRRMMATVADMAAYIHRALGGKS